MIQSQNSKILKMKITNSSTSIKMIIMIIIMQKLKNWRIMLEK